MDRLRQAASDPVNVTRNILILGDPCWEWDRNSFILLPISAMTLPASDMMLELRWISREKSILEGVRYNVGPPTPFHFAVDLPSGRRFRLHGTDPERYKLPHPNFLNLANRLNIAWVAGSGEDLFRNWAVSEMISNYYIDNTPADAKDMSPAQADDEASTINPALDPVSDNSDDDPDGVYAYDRDDVIQYFSAEYPLAGAYERWSLNKAVARGMMLYLEADYYYRRRYGRSIDADRLGDRE